MSGRMRRRQSSVPKPLRMFGLSKSFHAPQKDNSKRQKKKARLNNYKDQSHQRQPDND